MVIIMLSLNKKLKQIQTSIKREVYSASGRNTSLSYNTQNHMNIIVYKKLTFYTFVSSPVTESIINPLTIISSGINGCSIIARTVPFTDFSVSSKPSSHAPKSTPQKRRHAVQRNQCIQFCSCPCRNYNFLSCNIPHHKIAADLHFTPLPYL